MSLQGDRKRAAREKVAERAKKTRWLAISVVIAVHDRVKGGEGPPCPCCGSTIAEIVASSTYDDVLVDVRLGRRFRRSQFDGDPDFERSWAKAKKHTAYVSLPSYADDDGVTALEIVQDLKTKVLCVTGGNRSGKSEVGVGAALIRWVEVGGVPKDLFRFMGPDLPQAHIIANKFLARLPDELVTYRPPTPESRPQEIRLADGTVIQLRHAKRAGVLKGDGVVFTHWTEASVTTKTEAWVVVIGRTAQNKGQVFLDTTPADDKHWIKTAIINNVDAARAGLPSKLSAQSLIMGIRRNPWITIEDAETTRDAAAAVDPAIAERDFDGKWTAAGVYMWRDLLRPEVHLVDLDERVSLERLGLIDQTGEVSRALCDRSSPWILAVDVNYQPCRVVACKVFARSDEDTLEQHGILVAEVFKYDRMDAHQVSIETKARHNGRYAGALVVMDGTSCHDGRHSELHVRDVAASPKIEWEANGFRVIPPTLSADRKPYNPRVRDSSQLVREMLRGTTPLDPRPRLLLDRRGAASLWLVLQDQQNDGTGKPVKKPGSFSDRVQCSQSDPLRYVAWCVFGSRTYGRMRAIAAARAQGHVSRVW